MNPDFLNFFKVRCKVQYINWLLSINQIDKNNYYDRLTYMIMERVLSASSACMDIGCHIGSFLQKMIKLSPEGTFYAFEPVPSLFDHLKNTYPSEQVFLYNIALSDQVGRTAFNYVVSNPGYSGIKRRKYDRPEEKDIQIEVLTDTLDHLFHGRVIDLRFMKIDVEGAEYLVMKGGRQLIKQNKPYIVFEHGLGGADYYGIRPEDVHDLLCDECGLHISVLPDWLSGKEPLDRRVFCDHFYQGKDYYYLAHAD